MVVRGAAQGAVVHCPNCNEELPADWVAASLERSIRNQRKKASNELSPFLKEMSRVIGFVGGGAAAAFCAKMMGQSALRKKFPSPKQAAARIAVGIPVLAISAVAGAGFGSGFMPPAVETLSKLFYGANDAGNALASSKSNKQ